MSPLKIIRRLHAPLVCLAIACFFAAGCTVRQEIVFLGQPAQAYQADNGAVLLGYDVKPTPRVTLDPSPGSAYAGWHWLIIEPATADLLLKKSSRDATDSSAQIVSVSYEGWGSNAQLTPPLLEPGLQDRNPPVVGDGGLKKIGFVWDSAEKGVRLIGQDFSSFALIQVSPDNAVLRVREYDRDKMLTVLKVVAVAGLIVGLILLGGDTDISVN